ncbi:tetratricopeptide repeat protein [Saccharophagus degradans]|uniref:tetratricopeptide repeat protein n=2 Tax=Saccharophagus degradans TaxID=86304 RepID=UPI0000390D75|nr:tetratricopeptide repeat protein [Saccharophagus degradans]
MAMKYVNKLVFAALVTSAVLTLSACNTTGVKTTGADVEQAAELMATLRFVPVLEVDKEGVTQPYEALPNPYIKRGRIDKESVSQFITARRAFNKGDFNSATKTLNALTQSDSSLSGPWVLLGDIAMESKDTKLAITHYQKALEINRSNMNAWLRLAHALRVQGEFLKAQNVYAHALAEWKDCPEAHLNLAVLYDVYLNLPLRAQKHMEAYMFLTGGEDKKVANWLMEIQKRTGVAQALPADKTLLKPVS